MVGIFHFKRQWIEGCGKLFESRILFTSFLWLDMLAATQELMYKLYKQTSKLNPLMSFAF